MEKRGNLSETLQLGIPCSILLTALVSTVPNAASGYVPHDPISINGNEEFLPDNGVTSGAGTPESPYVIDGWEIQADLIGGIAVRDTDAAFIIRNVYVHGDPIRSNAAISLSNVSGGRIISSVLSDTLIAINVYSSSDIAISHSSLSARFMSIQLRASTGILVHHNNLLLAFVEDDRGSENAWDNGYPSGGNYWSGYAGEDNCSGPNQDVCPDPDGIGDAARTIDVNSTDRYPLMEVYDSSNTLPVAAFDASPATGDTTTVFALDASASWDAEDPPSRLEVRWDLDGDSVWDTDWSTAKEVRHQYSAPGNYTVLLEVRDTEGGSDTVGRQVAVMPGAGGLDSLLWVLLAVPLVVIGFYVLLRRRRAARERMRPKP